MPITAERLDHAIWGPCVFLEGKGDPEEIREAYAREAPGWPPLHFAVVRAEPEALDPWYRLGFAQMHAYGVRESGAEPVAAPGVDIRDGGPDDLETALRIDREIYAAQAASPSFSSFVLDEAAWRREWAGTLAADDVSYFVAERDGQAIGHATVYPDPYDDQALHLASTAVVPEARGGGVGLALTTHVLEYARRQGRARMWTNWRVTNLHASQYWPKRGFRVARIRLVRQVPAL